MPEGDTVWRTADRLNRALAGHLVTRCDLRFPSLATVDLTGAVTTAVLSRGKHLLHRFDSGVTLHSHLRMEGQWRIEASADLTSRALGNHQLRAAVGADRWTALGLRLGMLDLVPTERESDVVGHLGPDLLGPDWDLDVAVSRVLADDREIGAALLDQRNLAGIGTLWASETLFLARVNPWTPVASLDPSTVTAIVSSAQRLLDVSRGHAVQSSTGVHRLGEQAYVHARSGRPCRRCGDTVRVAMLGTPPRDRTIFSCPTCQGGLAPTDDGRPQRPLGSGGRGGEPRQNMRTKTRRRPGR